MSYNNLTEGSLLWEWCCYRYHNRHQRGYLPGPVQPPHADQDNRSAHSSLTQIHGGNCWILFPMYCILICTDLHILAGCWQWQWRHWLQPRCLWRTVARPNDWNQWWQLADLDSRWNGFGSPTRDPMDFEFDWWGLEGGPGRTSKPVNQLMKLKRVRQLLASTLVFYRVNWSVGFEKNHGFFWLVEGPNLGLLGTPKNPWFSLCLKLIEGLLRDCWGLLRAAEA